MSKRTRVVGYIRVSTEAQADGGVSLEAQRAKLSAYATAMDLDLVAVHVDAGLSAKTLARPGVLAALAMLEGGEAEGLLVAKLDRLTRSVRDLGDLVERYFSARFSLLSVADSIDTRSAAGRLVLNVLASVAQWEREATGERTRDALAHLRREGVRLGGAALGWKRTEATDDNGRRVVAKSDDELSAVARILELRDYARDCRDAHGRRLRHEERRTLARFHRARGPREGWQVTRWTADQLWGSEAVQKALDEPDPEPLTAALVEEARRYVERPGALRSWALAQPWPRFCTIVRIISGTILSETMGDD